MGNKQGSLGHHLDTASKTGALAFPSKVSYNIHIIFGQELDNRVPHASY